MRASRRRGASRQFPFSLRPVDLAEADVSFCQCAPPSLAALHPFVCLILSSAIEEKGKKEEKMAGQTADAARWTALDTPDSPGSGLCHQTANDPTSISSPVTFPFRSIDGATSIPVYPAGFSVLPIRLYITSAVASSLAYFPMDMQGKRATSLYLGGRKPSQKNKLG